MAQSNEGKWFVFQNGEILYGPPGIGQNLNADLQKRIADEIDAFLLGMVGDGAIGSTSWVVTAGAGLSVLIAVGGGVIDGQIVKSSGVFSVTVPPNTSGMTIYAKADTPWSYTLRGWPLTAAVKTVPLVAGELALATVDTDGASVILITDLRRVLTPVGALTEQKNSRARQAASGVL